MKKTITLLLVISLCLILGCKGDPGPLGPPGPTGTSGTNGSAGTQGASGTGTRTVYTGVLGTAPQDITVPGIDTSDMPLVIVYVYYNLPANPPYAFDCTGWFTYGCINNNKFTHYWAGYNGLPYKIVVIK
jgi:hypothetical protein